MNRRGWDGFVCVVLFREGNGDDEYKNNCSVTPPASGARGKKRKQQPEYLQKYEKHLGGLEVAKDAAQSTHAANRTYGFGNSQPHLWWS